VRERLGYRVSNLNALGDEVLIETFELSVADLTAFVRFAKSREAEEVDRAVWESLASWPDLNGPPPLQSTSSP
jgi:hypothetical protein